MNKKGTSDASVQIYGDGTLLYTSVPFNGSDNAISVYLDITGVKILKFCADGKNGSEQIALADVILLIAKCTNAKACASCRYVIAYLT